MKFIVIDCNTLDTLDMASVIAHESWANRLSIPDCFVLSQYGGLLLMDMDGNTAPCPPDRFIVKFVEEDDDRYDH